MILIKLHETLVSKLTELLAFMSYTPEHCILNITKTVYVICLYFFVNHSPLIQIAQNLMLLS